MAERPLITSEDFEHFEREWAELFAAVPGAPPFLHPAWHRVWLRHFGTDSSPVFLSVRQEEQLVGAAAFDMHREVAVELGDHNVRDYAGPLSLPGLEQVVAEGVLEWLREDLTPSAQFWGIARPSPMAEAISAAGAAGGWIEELEAEAVCPGVDLPGSFEEFVAALAKHDRHELRRKLRNFQAGGEVRFETLRQATSEAMDDLFRLMRASRDDKDEFLTPRMEAFFRDVAATFGELGMLNLGRLELDGQPVAATFSFETGGVTYLWNSGYDPEFTRLSVGLVSKAYAIRTAIETGQRRFDFLRGDEDYKKRLGGEPRELVRIRLRS